MAGGWWATRKQRSASHAGARLLHEAQLLGEREAGVVGVGDVGVDDDEADRPLVEHVVATRHAPPGGAARDREAGAPAHPLVAGHAPHGAEPGPADVVVAEREVDGDWPAAPAEEPSQGTFVPLEERVDGSREARRHGGPVVREAAALGAPEERVRPAVVDVVAGLQDEIEGAPLVPAKECAGDAPLAPAGVAEVTDHGDPDHRSLPPGRLGQRSGLAIGGHGAGTRTHRDGQHPDEGSAPHEAHSLARAAGARAPLSRAPAPRAAPRRAPGSGRPRGPG